MVNIELEFTKDGPILVRHEGEVKYALCRCGHSTKKPFCSGAHVAAGFRAEATKLSL